MTWLRGSCRNLFTYVRGQVMWPIDRSRRYLTRPGVDAHGQEASYRETVEAEARDAKIPVFPRTIVDVRKRPPTVALDCHLWFLTEQL